MRAFIRAASAGALLCMCALALTGADSFAIEPSPFPSETRYFIAAQAAEQGWTVELLWAAGDAWSAQGDLTRALPYWQAAVDAGGADSRLLYGLVEGYAHIGAWGRAAGALDALLTQQPDDPWAHYQAGLLRAATNPAAAADHLSRAATVESYRPLALELRAVIGGQVADSALAVAVGAALARVDLWPYAELAFQHAVDLSGFYPEALAYVALARAQQGKDGSAQMEVALAQAADEARVQYLHGVYLRALDDRAGSRDAFASAARLDPLNPAYYAELGTAYRLLNEMAEAERWLQTAVLISEDDPRFAQLLSLFYAETAYNTEAIIEAALAAAEGEVEWAQPAADAVDLLNTALALAPENPGLLMYKARLWLQSGNRDGARALLEQVAAAESPWQAEAQALLAELDG